MNMQRIRMIRSGKVIEAEDSLARALVVAGEAEYAEEEIETATEPVRKTERAARRIGRSSR